MVESLKSPRLVSSGLILFVWDVRWKMRSCEQILWNMLRGKVKMNNEKIPLDIKLMGIFVLIVLGGMSVMTVMSLQAPLPSTVDATMADGTRYNTIYSVSDYEAPSWYEGDPFWYNFGPWEGECLYLTLTPKVLAVDSVYLMRISNTYFLLDGSAASGPASGWGGYMRDPSNDVIKIAEYDMPANEIDLGMIQIPESEYSDSNWWIICFCRAMGYNGGLDNNPDGKVVIDIVVGE